MRFVYILPYATNRALVEYTVFSTEMLVMEQYRAALKAYIDTVLGAQSYHILAEEHHTIPMTEHPAPRRAGRHVMNIGTRGGRVKPSSGYAFTRIQRDAAAIVHSLQAHGHPFHVPASPRRYRLYDTLLLDVLERHGELGKRIFLRLFQRNSVQRVFRFLDEEGGLRENLQLLNSIPRWPFIRASIGTAISGRLP